MVLVMMVKVGPKFHLVGHGGNDSGGGGGCVDTDDFVFKSVGVDSEH